MQSETPTSWPAAIAATHGGAFVAGRWRCFGHAFRGLGFLLRREANARIHLVATLIVVAAGAALEVDLGDWRWLILAMALVWSAEAFNTAVEQVCDLVCPGPSAPVKAAKDVAAGAVLIAAVASAAIGIATVSPYLLAAFGGPGQ